MSTDTNEWDLLKDQFDVLVHDESVRSDSTENIFDDQFYRRFAELMNRIMERNSKTGYIDWSRR
jgi:predicted methyltransferase